MSLSRVLNVTTSTVCNDGDMVLADASAGNITITLPDSSAGTTVWTKKKDSSANTVTVVAANGQLLDGVSSYILSGIGEVVQWVSDGTGWRSATPSNSYAPIMRRFSSLPYGWNNTWKTKLAAAKAGTGIAHVMALGDSITAGSIATQVFTGSYYGLTRAAILAAGYTLYGDYRSIYSLTPNTYQAVSGTTPFGNAGTGATYYEAGLGRACGPGSTTAQWFQSYTPEYQITGFDVVFMDVNAGTWQIDLNGTTLPGSINVSIPGGTATVSVGSTAITVTNGGTGNYGNSALRKVVVTGLPLGTYTIRYGQGNASDVIMVNGISTYTAATSGVFFSLLGFSGQSATDWVARPSANAGVGIGSKGSAPTDKIALLSGQYSNFNVSPAGLGAAPFGLPTAPHLILLELSGVNDAGNRVPVQAYYRAIRRMCQALRRGQYQASIFGIAPSSPDLEVSDDTFAGDGWMYMHYKGRFRELMSIFNGAYLDVDAKWGELGFTQGFQQSANIHPTDAGHADIATDVIAAVVNS